jgi:uncharacterized protein YwgA
MENIFINIGVSTCMSMQYKNFVNLHPITNLKNNGIESRLSIEDIGMLSWPITDDDKNNIDMYIKDALQVLSSLMGLFLCHQQMHSKCRTMMMASKQKLNMVS